MELSEYSKNLNKAVELGLVSKDDKGSFSFSKDQEELLYSLIAIAFSDPLHPPKRIIELIDDRAERKKFRNENKTFLSNFLFQSFAVDFKSEQ